MNDDAIETLLREERLTTSADLDRRVLGAARDALSNRGGGRAPRGRWIALVAFAAAVLAIALGLALRRGDGARNGAHEGDRGFDRGVTRLGWLHAVGAEATVREAPCIARVEVLRVATAAADTRGASGATGPTGPTGESGGLALEARVAELLQGDASLVGREIVLVSDAASSRGAARRSFLAVEPITPGASSALPRSFLAALAPAAPPTDWRGRRRFTCAFDGDLLGTRVNDGSSALAGNGSGDSVDARVDRLRRALVASLRDPSDDVRYDAMRALRNWSGDAAAGPYEPSAELWRDGAVAKRLLAMGNDDDARVRWVTAWMVPREAGADGDALLRQLLFDPDPLVRQPAKELLRRRGHEALVAPLDEIADTELDGFLGAVTAPEMDGTVDELVLRLAHPQADVRARAAWALGAEPGDGPTNARAIDALARALRDPSVEVRRGAARSLGRIGDRAAIPSLTAAAADADGRVRVMVGWALARLGDAGGREMLTALLAGDDARAAAQAAERLGELNDERAIEALELAVARDPRATVRMFAVIVLGRVAPQRIVVANDASPLVRAAVEAYASARSKARPVSSPR